MVRKARSTHLHPLLKLLLYQCAPELVLMHVDDMVGDRAIYIQSKEVHNDNEHESRNRMEVRCASCVGVTAWPCVTGYATATGLLGPHLGAASAPFQHVGWGLVQKARDANH